MVYVCTIPQPYNRKCAKLVVAQHKINENTQARQRVYLVI